MRNGIYQEHRMVGHMMAKHIAVEHKMRENNHKKLGSSNGRYAMNLSKPTQIPSPKNEALYRSKAAVTSQHDPPVQGAQTP